jgi:hypothetical protein
MEFFFLINKKSSQSVIKRKCQLAYVIMYKETDTVNLINNSVHGIGIYIGKE